MFARKRKDCLAARALEEKLFDVIAAELQAGVRREGLWLKAISKSGGSESRRESEYVKLRMQALKDEIVIGAEHALEQTREQNRALEETARDEADKERRRILEENADATMRAEFSSETTNLVDEFKRLGFEISYKNSRWVIDKLGYGRKRCRDTSELEKYLGYVRRL